MPKVAPNLEHIQAGNQVLLPPDLDPVDISTSGRLFGFNGTAFGTNYNVQMVRAGSADPEQDDAWIARLDLMCRELLEMVDRQMSPWRAESDLCRFNDLEDGEVLCLPEPMRAVVGHGLNLHALTGGMFDIGIYGATSLWGFGAENMPSGLPDPKRHSVIKEQRSKASLPLLEGANLTKPAGYKLDLCGIAKGYAVDLLLSALRNDPETSAALVEIGGEFKGYGAKPDGMPWWVELSSDGAKLPIRTLIGLHEWACASSGGANRSFTHEGRAYSHAIDPRTFEPVQTDIISAHVLDRECWRADALATAIFAMGSKQALAFAEAQNIPCLMLVDSNNTPVIAQSAAFLEWHDDE